MAPWTSLMNVVNRVTFKAFKSLQSGVAAVKTIDTGFKYVHVSVSVRRLLQLQRLPFPRSKKHLNAPNHVCRSKRVLFKCTTCVSSAVIDFMEQVLKAQMLHMRNISGGFG